MLEISKLSDYDYICIVATYNNAGVESRESDLASRGYSKAAIDALNKQIAEKTKAIQIRSLNVKLSGDLSRYHYPYMEFIITAYHQFEVGTLPFEGCLADQPAQIIEIFNVLEQLKFEAQKRAHVEAEREAKRKQRKVNGRR